MTDESTLVRIADLARTLRAACPGDVANLRKAGESLQWCRDYPENTTDRLTADALHAYNAYRALVDEYAGHLRELLKLVYQHLPAEGRNLRELPRVDAPLDAWDWDLAAGELHHIEVAALTAATPTGEPLTDTEQAVFDVIRSKGPITGKKICNTVGTDQGTLTSRIIPVLKKRYGVKNKRGAGYYVP